MGLSANSRDSLSTEPASSPSNAQASIENQSARSQAACIYALEQLQKWHDGGKQGGVPKEVDLEKEYTNMIKYKNYYLKARLLHYAIWRADRKDEDVKLVTLVLESKADLRSRT